MKFLEPLYITVIGIAFLVSLSSFRWNFPFYLKFFSVLLGITFLAELTAVYWFRVFNLKTNSPIYNIFMPLEFTAYAFFFKQILTNRKAVAVAKVFLVLLPLAWLATTLFKFGLMKWNSYFLILGSCCTVILSVLYYAQLLANREPVKLLRVPEFFIVTGMLIFYTCLLPYLGSLNYLIANHKQLAISLLDVLRILNIFMYSLFIYAYICQMKVRK
ncbi:MAG TPA: hypothetical protein VGD17_16640 [Chitinophagaceae bacterium]